MEQRVLKLDHEYYYYPEEAPDLDSFIHYLNETDSKFIRLTQLLEENCVEPFFIDTEVAECYLNISGIAKIQAGSVTILSKAAYDERLAEWIATTCIGCENYTEDQAGDNLAGHRNKLDLNGHCFFRTPIEDAESVL